MNVIFVTDSARLDGGISHVAIQSAAALARNGHRVYYFTAEGPADPVLTEHLPEEQIVVQASRDILTDRNRLRASINGIANRDCSRALKDLLQRFDATDTVVHLHGWCKNLSPLIVRAALDSELPVVQTLHEYFMVCPNGAFYNFKNDSICHRRPLGLDCITCNCDSRSYSHKLWRLARTAFQRYALTLPSRNLNYITNSPLSRRIFLPFIPSGAGLYHLNNPISIGAGARTTPETKAPLLFVGRFSREKGVLPLARAVHELDLPAIFVGDGHLRGELERLAPKAKFTGWLNREGVEAQMRLARALVFPSTWYETQGLVTIEAAAVGLPSLISDCTAATDFLPNRKRALHFRHDSYEDLKRGLLELQDHALVQRLSTDVFDWYWNDPWTVDRHRTELEEIYRQILVRHRETAPVANGTYSGSVVIQG